MHSLIYSLARSAGFRRLSLALGLAVAAACGDRSHSPTSPASTALVPALARGGNGDNNGRIVFTSSPGGTSLYELYAMNADGTGVTRLTNSLGLDTNGSLSPDGKRVVFESERDGPGGKIYVMNADGTGVTRLTDAPGHDRRPVWSKDGKRIAFESTRDGTNPLIGDGADYEIYVMNADGTSVTRLTYRPGFDGTPSWSADGKQIAFISDRANAEKNDVYIMNADGSRVTRVTYLDWPLFMSVAWSPGGKQLAFSTSQVFVVNADGTQLTQLTWGEALNGEPSWSSDAKQIAFMSYRDGNAEIYTMNADGTGVTRLTNSLATDFFPAWGR